MTDSRNHSRSWPRAIGIGIGVSLLTASVMIPLMKSGLSPLPKPLGLAFAETLLDRVLPLPVGAVFHTVYVTFWSVIFVRFFPQRDIKTSFLLALGLWLVVLLLFFPMVGWGLAGLTVGPKLIPASLSSHVLFGLCLWGLDRFTRRKSG